MIYMNKKGKIAAGIIMSVALGVVAAALYGIKRKQVKRSTRGRKR